MNQSFNSIYSSSSQMSKKKNIDGEDIQTIFDYRILSYAQNLSITIPPTLQAHNLTDKNIKINYIQLTSSLTGRTQQQNQSERLRMIAQNQRNNFDEQGKQTNVIGYMLFDNQKQAYCGDSVTFEQDARLPIAIIVQIYNQATSQWNNIQLNAAIPEFIYYDITCEYVF